MDITVKNIESNQESGLVKSIIYTCMKNYQDNSAEVDIIFRFDETYPQSTPFSLLTEEEVINWITKLRGENYLLEIEKFLNDKLNNKANKERINTSTPW